jgi:hypothetical protein
MSSDYHRYESSRVGECEGDHGDPRTLRKCDDRTFKEGCMRDYFWTDEFEEE